MTYVDPLVEVTGHHELDATVVGFDVVILDGDGRIASVLGFLDRVPA